MVLQSYFSLWVTKPHKIRGVNKTISAAAAAAESLQLCPTLCDPIEGSPPGSPVPGILQARTLEWLAISFSNAWNEKSKWSRSVVFYPQRPHGLQPTRLLRPWDFPGKSTGVGCHCRLRRPSLLSLFLIISVGFIFPGLVYTKHVICTVLNSAFTFYVELLNHSSVTLLVLRMFCSEIIHFFTIEHFGYLKFFVTRNSSVLDILHICLLVYLVLLSLDWFSEEKSLRQTVWAFLWLLLTNCLSTS